MKTRKQYPLLGIAALFFLFSLVLISCPHHYEEEEDPDGINSELNSILAGLPANTANTPHTVILNVSSLTGFRGALNANPKKFVNLDLSGSTFTDIKDKAFFYGNDYFYRDAGPPPGYGCKTLTGITIPDSVTGIGESAFLNCNNLTSVTIPDSVTSIGRSAFSSCTSLAGVTIPNSVTSIGRSAFSSCTSLAGVTIPDSVTTISIYAFSGCRNLTSVTIPDSVTTIGDWAFSHCTSLTGVTIPNSVTTISTYAFSSCTSLADITIPDSVISISPSSFRYCSSLMSIFVANGNTKYSSADGILYNKNKTTLIIYPEGKTDNAFTIIPNSVTRVGAWAFGKCTSLASVTIPNSVTSIDGGAFYESKITSVTISKSVTSIGDNAFGLCYSLTSVTFEGTIPSNGFKTISINNHISVPFPGDLRDKFYATNKTNGTPGTYTTTNPGYTAVWTKQ